jgi:hypothetical protein
MFLLPPHIDSEEIIMNNFNLTKFSLPLTTLVAAILLPLVASAEKLPNGTLLTLNPGVVTNNSCISGSCFSMEIVDGFRVWTALESGTDGGLLLGKNQLSGGQEIGTDSETNTTTSEITKAFFFFGNYGTFSTVPMTGTVAGVTTSDASLNFFDNASCIGVSCNAVAQLGTWNVAWGGMAVPMGSAGGCLSPKCTPEQLNGIFVTNWTVNPDSTYSLDYSQVVPDGHPSGFGNQTFTLRLAGTLTTPGTVVNLPPVANEVQLTGPAGVVLTWKPVVTDPDNGPNPLTCFIDTPPANGSATVAADCSSGSYISGIGFSDVDTFTYGASDGLVKSNIAQAIVSVTGSPSTACTGTYPIRQQTLRKSKLTIALTGNLSKVSRKEVKICPTTRLEYNASSPAPYNYPVTCYINNVVAAPKGYATVGAQLKCNVRPYASDEYKINIKSAI